MAQTFSVRVGDPLARDLLAFSAQTGADMSTTLRHYIRRGLLFQTLLILCMEGMEPVQAMGMLNALKAVDELGLQMEAGLAGGLSYSRLGQLTSLLLEAQSDGRKLDIDGLRLALEDYARGQR